ncbi:Os08g0137225 [Oryza sativa Japonica Group]|uniref:Os08g0137225 protein n=1 Tax=Oryza sativa subsp. japonica TaxID=39947 RepID=A0A0P0XBJ9_ORYSJ|nr:hypothetical protein EE612_042017 [Oryza sativa]BAT03752.1 Os08g0137225 [Oryza sativa Japonica Group]
MLPPIQTLNRLSTEFPLAKTFTRVLPEDSCNILSTSFSSLSFNCRIDDEPPESYPQCISSLRMSTSHLFTLSMT